MAKKVVASLRDTSGIKYAKLIKSVKSEKTGSYSFKEEIVIEDHVKDILAGKTQQDIINEIRAKEKEAQAAKIAADTPKDEAPAADTPKDEAPAADTPKEEAPAAKAPKDEAPAADTPKDEAPAAEAPKKEGDKSSKPE